MSLRVTGVDFFSSNWIAWSFDAGKIVASESSFRAQAIARCFAAGALAGAPRALIPANLFPKLQRLTG